MNSQLVVNPPIYANMPSCLVYIRPFGAVNGGVTFKDWSPNHRTVFLNAGVANSTARQLFSPCSMYWSGAAADYIYVQGSADFILGNNWIGCARVNTGTPANTTLAIFQIYPDGNNQMYVGMNGTEIDVGYQTSAVWVSFGYKTAFSYTASSWHNLVFGASSGTTFLYVDGVNQNLSNYVSGGWGSSSLNSTPLQIGVNTTRSGYHTGYMDEFALWSASSKGAYPIPTAAQLNALVRRLIV